MTTIFPDRMVPVERAQHSLLCSRFKNRRCLCLSRLIMRSTHALLVHIESLCNYECQVQQAVPYAQQYEQDKNNNPRSCYDEIEKLLKLQLRKLDVIIRSRVLRHIYCFSCFFGGFGTAALYACTSRQYELSADWACQYYGGP